MAVLNPADLKVGDIVYGYFSADDRRQEAWHYAMVLYLDEGGVFVALVGTSLKDSESDVRYGMDVLVVSPKTASQHWAETGLVKPTRFAGDDKFVRLTPGVLARSQAEKVGTAKAVLDAFIARHR